MINVVLSMLLSTNQVYRGSKKPQQCFLKINVELGEHTENVRFCFLRADKRLCDCVAKLTVQFRLDHTGGKWAFSNNRLLH